MFSKKITDSDAFIEMSSAAQALYFHLNQGADDDGFNNQVQMAMFKAHASVDDLKVLLAKNYLIRFESGVIVVKHWRMHNTLRKDRYTPTNFQEELAQLGLKDNGSYTLGCQVVAKRLPQEREGKDRLGKDNSFIHSVESEDSKNEDIEAQSRRFLQGIGKGVVFLSPEQMSDLLEKINVDEFNHYVGVIADCELNGKPFTKKTHYEAILDMAMEDRKVRK